MRAVAMDPPQLAIDNDELMRRLDELCNGAHPDGASVMRACVDARPDRGRVRRTDRAVARVGRARAGRWSLPDPYLLFYLRWSVVLEREADALMWPS